MNRVAVFIDYQNTYMRAREVFGSMGADSFVVGQVLPRRLGVHLVQRGRVVDPARQLSSVAVYRGEPDSGRSSVGQAACHRQVSAWRRQALVEARTRPLRYRHIRWTDGSARDWEAREKGIDVLIAVDMVRGAIEDRFDVAVLVSADNDLVPALEAVVASGKRVEVASWRTEGRWSPRLEVPGREIWCHWLERHDYEMVHDPTDYTRPAA